MESAARPAVEPARPKNLVQKLCEVMASIDPVAKKGENKFHGYKYAKESDIVEAIRGELSKRSVFIFPNIVSHTRTGDVTDIMVEWTFVDGDSGETRTCIFPGCGSDKSDKGVYKALTGSEKYFLMKSFLIPTGDDPEKDSKDEIEDAKQKSKDIARSKVTELRDKLGKPVPKDAALFYAWPPELEGKVAYVTGDKSLQEANLELLRSAGNYTIGPDKKVSHWNIPGQKFDDLKYMLEQRGVPFYPLKAM